MASRRGAGPTIASGRRGYLRYQYGSHFWVPETQASWDRGMIRDTAREAIPAGAVYDSADYLLHQPGVAQKRGGTSYAGPALTGASFAIGIVQAPFFAGSQLLAVGSNGHLFKVTVGTTTDIGAIGYTSYAPPMITPGGLYTYLPNGTSASSKKYDGATITDLDGGALQFYSAVTYKSRLVAVNTGEEKLYFSPVPDVNTTPWDVSNSWIQMDYSPTGLAALNNALLVFSAGHTERIIGATPPPNSDMDRAPLAPIGCTDARSIVTNGPYVFFANPDGVYLTNGSTPVSLTEQGGISSYWRGLFSGYLGAIPFPGSGTWTIAAGYFRGFLFVSVLNDSRALQATLMCNVARRAWWRLTNVAAMGYANSVDGTELYYANGDTNRVTALSGIFSPAAGNKNDANGTAVTPSIEFAPIGQGSGVKAYGFGRLDFDMRDAASDNPTMAVTVKSGVEADTSTTPAESPLAETTTLDRRRFSVCREAQAVTIALAQTNASSKTEIYALEVEQRPQSLVGDGIT